MDIETFEEWSLVIGLSLLIIFMGFIMYDLGKKSNAGRIGMFAIFLALGLGVLGFVLKYVIKFFIGGES